VGADFSLNAIQPTVIAVSGRIWAADVPDTTVKSENCIVSRAKTSIEYSLPNNSSVCRPQSTPPITHNPFKLTDGHDVIYKTSSG
jgi:hypothetical protein